MSSIQTSSINLVKTAKTVIILLIMYSLFEQFYIGPEVGKTLTWILAYFLLLMFSNRKFKMGRYGKYFLLFLIVILSNMILTVIVYNVNILGVLFDRRWYFYLLLYFILIDYCKEQKNWDRLIILLTVCSIIISVFILLQGYLRSYVSNSWFLNSAARLSAVEWRNGRVRLSLCAGIRILSWVYSSTQFVIHKKEPFRKLHFLNAALNFLAFILFDNTRMYTIILLVILGILFFFGIELKSHKKTMVLKIFTASVCVFVIIIEILIDAGLMQSMTSMLTVLSTEGSWYARIGAYIYYLKIIVTHPVMGMGVISDTILPSAISILHGPYGIYYTSDVGIIGTTATLGLFGGFLYLFIVCSVFFRNIKRHQKGKWSMEESVSILMVLFLFTLSMLDRQRIFMLPFCLLILEKYEIFHK